MSEDIKQVETKEKPASKADLSAENEALRAELEAIKARSASETPVVTYEPSDPMRPVTIELPYDGDKYKDDLYVSNSMRNYQIQRGKPVVVPYHIAMTIKESAAQDKATARLIAIKELEFQEAVQRITK